MTCFCHTQEHKKEFPPCFQEIKLHKWLLPVFSLPLEILSIAANVYISGMVALKNKKIKMTSAGKLIVIVSSFLFWVSVIGYTWVTVGLNKDVRGACMDRERRVRQSEICDWQFQPTCHFENASTQAGGSTANHANDSRWKVMSSLSCHNCICHKSWHLSIFIELGEVHVYECCLIDGVRAKSLRFHLILLIASISVSEETKI